MHTWVIVRFQQYSIHHSCRDGVYLAIARCFVCMSFRSYYGKSLDYSSSLCRQSLTWEQWGGVINTLWHFDENKMLLNLWPHMCDCDLLSSSRGAAQKNPTQHMHARSKTFVTYYYIYLYEFHKSLIAAQFLSFSGAFTNCSGRGHYEGFRVEPDFVQLYSSYLCQFISPVCHDWMFLPGYFLALYLPCLAQPSEEEEKFLWHLKPLYNYTVLIYFEKPLIIECGFLERLLLG